LGDKKDIRFVNKIWYQQFPKILLWNMYKGPGLTWINLWQDGPVKQ